MKAAVNQTAGDWVIYLLAALGVTFSPHEYFGGLFWAMAAAMITRHWLPERDGREMWLVLVTAFVVATIGAVIYLAEVPDGDLPVQVIMAGLGFASRFIGGIAMAVMFRAEVSSATIFDRLVDRFLPPRKDDK